MLAVGGNQKEMRARGPGLALQEACGPDETPSEADLNGFSARAICEAVERRVTARLVRGTIGPPSRFFGILQSAAIFISCLPTDI